MMLPIFVYGTLRSGEGNYWVYLAKNLEHEIPAITEGELYDVGGFPALLPGSKEVHGELMYIKNNMYDNVLNSVDRLEGYQKFNKEASMYIRKRIITVLSSGESINAWGYIWNHDAPKRKIQSGDWKKYVNEIWGGC